MTTPLAQSIRSVLHRQLGLQGKDLKLTALAGGSGLSGFRVDARQGERFFCKVSSLQPHPELLLWERSGLQFLDNLGLIRVPRVLACESTGDAVLLVMEWIEQAPKTINFWRNLGTGLAAMHRQSAATYGFKEDNYLGTLPQQNTPLEDWPAFLIRYRFEPQVRLALDQGYLDRDLTGSFDRLYPILPDLYTAEPPALLHGDLWHGNVLCDLDQQPVLIDPAIYFGHRSMDMAMTRLFGGFDPAFYSSYQANFAGDRPDPLQEDIARLYPLLVHLNLFGRGYLPQIREILSQF